VSGEDDDGAADTARFELVITRMDRPGRLFMEGTYDYRRREGSLTAKLEGTEDSDTDTPNEVRYFGEHLYAAQELDGTTFWVEDNRDDEQGTGYPNEVIVPFPESDRDPKQALALILAAGDEQELGQEELGGTETTHYRVKLEPKDLSRELNGRLLDEAAGPFSVDVWADDAARLRRIRIVEAEEATLTYDFFDFGVEVDVERPPADQVVTQAEFARINQRRCDAPGAKKDCRDLKEQP
jgi:hypothetical protein